MKRSRSPRRWLFGIFCALLGAGCGNRQPPSNPNLWREFSGERAFAHVRKLVELGPRPPASPAIEAARVYITSELERNGWRVARQSWTEETPRGRVPFTNLIATRADAKSGARAKFLVASHYDTKTFDTIRFVGANDGGSSTGALLELARVLATDPPLAARTELVFFDGEEAYEAFTETDGLYGSRYFARQLTDEKRTGDFRGGILLDMIGDKDLGVTLPPDSPEQLARGIFTAAEAVQARDHFTYFGGGITDDHTPLNAAGIPTIDLIDFDFPAWHTAEDTLDKISAKSLQTVGAVTTYYLSELAFR